MRLGFLFSFVLLPLVSACSMGGERLVSDNGIGAGQIGEIYDTRTGSQVSETQLINSLRQADFVLLGEKHDNLDHHVNQAAVVGALGDRVSAVVFEMVGTDQQLDIVEYLAANPGDSNGLGPALDWAESGWPDWADYEPIAAAALEVDALVVAGNVPRSKIKEIYTDGLSALPPKLVERTELYRPLAPAQQEELSDILAASHCGSVSEEVIPSLLLVQRARDASMADRLARTSKGGIGVLIAGAGHVRTDWGVPLYLSTLAPDKKVVSVGMIEIGAFEGEQIADLPFDYVWLTPRVQPVDYDPCEAFTDPPQPS